MTIVLTCALLLVQSPLPTPSPQIGSGAWHAWLDGPAGPVPFDLDLEFGNPQARPSARVRNGEEVVQIPDVWLEPAFEGNPPVVHTDVRMRIPLYDSHIRARISEQGTALDGEWRKTTGPGREIQMPFHARAGAAPRFDASPGDGGKTRNAVIGRWKVRFEKDAEPAVAIFRAGEAEGEVAGTVLTATGDYRYLAGAFDGEELRLSCFDGAHAFLLTASLQDGPSLKGTFTSGPTYTDAWTAVRDESAALSDEMAHARWNDAFGLAQLAYPDLEGNIVSLADPRFAGRVRVLQITGSWCPNCQDETAFLAKLEREHRDEGLSVIALCFEVTGERERDTAQARAMMKRHGADYLALLAGRNERALAQQALPALDRVFAFPTTVFLHRDGRVRAVHSGFSGPATGADHEKLRRTFTTMIEELLAEPPPPASPHEHAIVHELWRDERARTLTHFEARENGELLYETREILRFGAPMREDPVEAGRVKILGTTVSMGPHLLHYDPRALVMLDPSDVEHRYTPAVRSPFPVIDGRGSSEMPEILAGLSSTDALMRREAAFYLALQLVQDAQTPPEYGGGRLDPGLAINLLPLVADPDPQVRATASLGAGVTQLHKAGTALATNLDHGFAPVRRESARALGRLRQASALSALEHLAVHDVDPLVRAAAEQSASLLRPK